MDKYYKRIAKESKNSRYTREGLPVVTKEIFEAFLSETARNTTLENCNEIFSK
jgi:hypothetical protein